jgi:hypothetical protein
MQVAIRSVVTTPPTATPGRSVLWLPPPVITATRVVFGLELEGPRAYVELVDDPLSPGFPERTAGPATRMSGSSWNFGGGPVGVRVRR